MTTGPVGASPAALRAACASARWRFFIIQVLSRPEAPDAARPSCQRLGAAAGTGAMMATAGPGAGASTVGTGAVPGTGGGKLCQLERARSLAGN